MSWRSRESAVRNFALNDDEVRLIKGLRLITKAQKDAILDAVAMLSRKHQPSPPTTPIKPSLSVVRSK
jgi:hypothetical protein